MIFLEQNLNVFWIIFGHIILYFYNNIQWIGQGRGILLMESLTEMWLFGEMLFVTSFPPSLMSFVLIKYEDLDKIMPMRFLERQKLQCWHKFPDWGSAKRRSWICGQSPFISLESSNYDSGFKRSTSTGERDNLKHCWGVVIKMIIQEIQT